MNIRNTKKSTLGFLAAAAGLFALLIVTQWPSDKMEAIGVDTQEASVARLGQHEEGTKLSCVTTHEVEKGEFLDIIAYNHGIDPELLILANRDDLLEKYEVTCSKFSDTYRNSPGRRGTFCNDRFRRAYANTLRPGWAVCIPSQNVPESVEQVVMNTPGRDVVLVIDDTGSMDDDRTTVANFYAQALKRHGRNINGIYLYADKSVYRVTNIGDSRVQGDFENTFAALSTAIQEEGPDIVYLITDEEGDDWPENLANLGFPTVVASCLPNKMTGTFECEQPLKQLARATGGTYVPVTFR